MSIIGAQKTEDGKQAYFMKNFNNKNENRVRKSVHLRISGDPNARRGNRPIPWVVGLLGGKTE